MNGGAGVAMSAVLAVCVGLSGLAGESGTTIGLPEGAIARLEVRRVCCVAYSSEGTWLAVGTSLGVELRSAESLKLVAALTGHLHWVNSIAFSGNGAVLASGALEGTIKLWDVSSGRELRTFDGLGFGAISLALSANGATLGSGLGWPEHAVRLWDVETGREIRTLTGHTGSVCSVAFSPDGAMLVSGSVDRTTKLWDVQTGREIRTLTGHSDSVYSVAFSPDGTVLASGSGDQTIKLWDVASGRELQTLTGHGQTVFSVAFSPDGMVLASGSGGGALWGEGTVLLWDVVAVIGRR